MCFLKMFQILLLTVSIVIKGNLSLEPDKVLLVNSTNGLLEGYLTETLNGKQYFAFEGIPYAKPPTGKNRFEEPIPKEPWKGTWKANILHTCLQYFHSTATDNYPVIGQEDCLYLNIYTPYKGGNASYDVIIFIHGGAFMFNSGGTYGPKYILDRDIVFVTMNYRLGPLGFLSTEDDTLPGNLGIKDQILALKWIKENIHNFNGNSDSITLTGMSAGGASVHLHYITPLSSGLFHRGIAQSGTMLNPWVLVENSKDKAAKLAAIVGCTDGGSSKEMVKCLKTRPGYQIVSAVKHFQKWLYNPISPFGIVIDKWSTNPVLSDHPYNLLKKKQIQHLPLIFSHVSAEGLYPGADFIRKNEYLEFLDGRWNDLLPHILEYNNTIPSENLNSVSEKIRKFYLGNESLTADNYSKLIQCLSDRLFIVDIEKAAKLHSWASNSSTFYYFFSYRGVHSKSEIRTEKNFNYGVSHADDTVYVLYSNIDMRSNENDRKMSEVLLDVWITFAQNGNPKIPKEQWGEVSKNLKSKLKYLHIESPDKISMKQSETMGNKGFWEMMEMKENERLLGNHERLL